MRPALIFIFSALITTCAAQRFLAPLQTVDNLYSLGSKAILFADDGVHGREAWVSDGTSSGTHLIKDIMPGYNWGVSGKALTMDGYLYFQGNTKANGSELWRTDGTEQGTTMVVDLQPNEPNPYNPYYVDFGSNPTPMIVFKNSLYFLAYKPHTGQYGMYRTDGTEGGTSLVNDYGFEKYAATDNYLYFANFYNGVMYRTDGTNFTQLTLPETGGEKYVYDIEPGANGIFVVIGNYYYPNNFARLYYFNQSNDQFELIKDFSGTNDVSVANLTYSGGKLFFSVDTESSAPSSQLWVSDGTPAGTSMIKSDAWSPYYSDTNMSSFNPYNNGLVFMASGTEYRSVWFSDGTVEGTSKISEEEMYRSNDLPIPATVAGDFYFLSTTKHIISFDTEINMDVQFSQFGNDYLNSSYAMTTAGDHVFFTGNDGYGMGLWIIEPAPEINVGYSEYSSPGIQSNYGSFSWSSSKVDSCYTNKLYIKSVGTSDLYISSISVSNPDWYLAQSEIPAALKPGESIAIPITFIPAREGLRTGALEIYNNDGNEPIYTIKLSGYGQGQSPFGCKINDVIKVKEIRPQMHHSKLLLDVTSVNASAQPGTVVGNFSLEDENGPFSIELIDDPNSNNNVFTVEDQTLKVASSLKFGRKMLTVKVRAVREDESFVEDIFLITIDGDPSQAPVQTCWTGFEDMNFSIYDVAINSAGHYFAVGDNGKVIYSKDKGVTWEEKRITNLFIWGYTLTDIKFYGKLGVILGYSAFVFHSLDDGETWSMVGLTPGGDAIRNASFFDEQNGFGVDTRNRIWRTRDGGRNWEGGWQPQVFDPVTPLAAGPNTVIFKDWSSYQKSIDGGKTWTSFTTPGNVVDGGIWFVNDLNWYLIAANSIYETNDGGTYWYRKGALPATSGSMPATFASVSGSNMIVIVPYYGVYQSSNEGASWTQLYDMTGGAITNGMIRGNYGVATIVSQYSGTKGRAIFTTSDGGATWELSNYIPNTTFISVNFPSSKTGFATTSQQYGGPFYGPYYKTTDGGISWKAFAADKGFSNVYFRDELTGFGTAESGLYKTTDGGDHWNMVHSAGGSQYSFFGDHGVLMGNKVRWTDNGGETWTDGIAFDGSILGQMSFVNSQVGYISRYYQNIYKTIDGGHTWDEIEDTGDLKIWGIWFYDTSNGIAGGENGAVYRTTNGGVTWNKTYTEMSGTVVKLYVRSTGEIIATTNDYSYVNVWSSTDGGMHFNKISNLEGSGYIQVTETSIYFAEPGYSSSLWKQANGISAPAPPTISGPAVVCLNETAQFGAAAAYLELPEWTFDGPGGLTSNGAVAEAKFPGTGTFKVGARVTNGCGTSEFSYMTVDVKDMQVPLIDGPAEVPGIGKFTPENADVQMEYNWYAESAKSIDVANNEATIKWSEATNSIIQLSQKDPVSLCRATAYLEVVVTKGAPDDDPHNPDDPDDPVTGLESPNHLSVYPNPSSDVVYISIPEGATGDIVFLDSVGRKMSLKQSATSAGTYSYDVSDYSAGIYLIKLKLSTGQELGGRLLVK